MPIASRTFRVFVSSTFEDLKEERDALQRDVFPKLRTLCEQHGARFQAIDLRWGVRDEAGARPADHGDLPARNRALPARPASRPNFIVLLGDRYGWQPLPARIPATEFDALKPHLPSGDVAAQADRWYQLDENAVPAGVLPAASDGRIRRSGRLESGGAGATSGSRLRPHGPPDCPRRH